MKKFVLSLLLLSLTSLDQGSMIVQAQKGAPPRGKGKSGKRPPPGWTPKDDSSKPPPGRKTGDAPPPSKEGRAPPGSDKK